MQVLSARPYFEHKTQECNVWVGSGMFCLRTLEGNFTSEDHVLVAQITQLDGAVCYYACFQGNKVRIDEGMFRALSGAFCAGDVAPIDAFFHQAVEGYWLNMMHD
ncbi:hypothetical protein MD588_00935 [Photobacterium sp. SDRW27]|uniref:hypothetical protein n=1 Tax=Photobacterium obscurum TaxID=2829490 RepID=UPI002243279E|nr:hypothetical protein [Photobacterium obscurum]MCW8327365.1 hypothetical protein [Photobacterium obscurum]